MSTEPGSTYDRSRDERSPSLREIREDQQVETSDIALGSPAQWRGALVGALLGALLGAVVASVVALAVLSGAARVVIPVMGALFGMVAGAVYQGGRNPERAGELQAPDGRPDASSAVASNPDQDEAR
jgi:outer membrane lipoprotein SlyB